MGFFFVPVIWASFFMFELQALSHSCCTAHDVSGLVCFVYPENAFRGFPTSFEI